MLLRFLALVFAIAVLGAGPASAGEVVRIGWLRAPNDLTLAKAHGSLEKALAARGVGVEWQGPFAAAAPAFEALYGGSIDITAGSSTAVVTALAGHFPLVVFACQKISPAAEGILVAKDAPIASLADLVGKKVAVNRGGTGEYLLLRALATAGIDAGKVARVYLTPADSGPAFAEGHVDAWATWDPFVTIARTAYGARVLADGKAIGSDNAVVLVAARAFAEAHRDLLQVIFDVVEEENRWAMTHKAEAGAIWAQAMGLDPALADQLGDNNAVPTHGVTADDIAGIGRVADWYFDLKIIPERPDVAAGTLSLR